MNELESFKRELEMKNLELVETIKKRDKFFSIIAHDLRSPFNGFLGLTEILCDENLNMSDSEKNELLKTLNKSAVNTYNLLESLLEWSRMQQGMTSFVPFEIYLRSEISKTIKIFQDLADNKEIRIICEIPPSLKVLADLNMLQIVMRNLVSNALKFSHRGGEVTIKAQKLDDNFVKIFVKDNGIGMDKKILDNLFELDDRSYRRKGTEGEASSGLGLILCKDFIEKNGGELHITSQTNEGSSFSFTLPAFK